MSREYLIIGSDNHWYASCLRSLRQVDDEVANIREHPEEYGQDEPPETLYVYAAKVVSEKHTNL